MGRDKALVEFRGQPLVVHALETLRGAGLVASIAGARSTLCAFAAVVEDSEPGLGPLSGICAALNSSTARWALFVPVDLPLLPASLVRYLLDHAQTTGSAVTLVSVGGFVQTFPAVLDRVVLPLVQSELDAGRGGCFAAFKSAAAGLGQQVNVIATELLVQAGQVGHPDGLPAARWFFNVNSPDDLSAPTGQGFSRKLNS